MLQLSAELRERLPNRPPPGTTEIINHTDERHPIYVKRAANRPKDREDLRYLRRLQRSS